MPTGMACPDLLISYNQLTDEGLYQLVLGLKNHGNLTQLNMSNNSFTSTSGKYLAELIVHNLTLTSLGLLNISLNHKG